MNRQQGFTLIELVVVIIILGILAVTAAPKFIDLQSDARLATLQGMKAALQSGSTLIHSKAAVQQIERRGAGCLLLSGTATTSCTGDGEVNLAFGYPLARFPTDSYRNNFGSAHTGVCNFVLGDGSTRGVSIQISTDTLGRLKGCTQVSESPACFRFFRNSRCDSANDRLMVRLLLKCVIVDLINSGAVSS